MAQFYRQRAIRRVRRCVSLLGFQEKERVQALNRAFGTVRALPTGLLRLYIFIAKAFKPEPALKGGF